MKYLSITIIFLIGFRITSLQAEVSLTFGVYTSDKPTTMVRMFRPVLNSLETLLTNKLGDTTHITMKVARTYDQGIDDIVTGRVDFARMGPASYVISKNRNPDLQLLAMESSKGSKTFYGLICVQKQSPIQNLSQLKGRTFAFSDERSTIGRYLSQHLLMKQGVYASDLAAYEYLGRHDRVGTAVGAGQFDAGALKESTFKKLISKGVEIRELARFPNITKPWIARSDMHPEMVNTLKDSLLSLDDPTALKSIKKDGFLPAEDSDYAPIRESIQRNSDFFMQTHDK